MARDRGFLPLVGIGGALQQDLTYAPLVEALRPLVRQRTEPGRPALVEGLLDLGRLFGDLSLPPGPELGDPGLERTRLFESVCRLLERASARQPLALLLDDVHWIDRGSLALVYYLVRGLATRPLLVLLTYREDEAGAALFVGALVGSFVDSGALYRYDGRWALAPQRAEAVPAVVSALLQSQVERLRIKAREVLDLLAVCGAQVDHLLLEQLLPDDRLLCGLAALRAAGLVVEEVVDGRIGYRAAHTLICEVAYDPLVVRRRRHAEVARTVQEYAPEQRGLLAEHVRRAGDEIDSGHTLEVLLAAADQALARKAGDEALANVRAALDLAEARRDVLPGLLDRLAEACELTGPREDAVSAWLAAAAEQGSGMGRADRLHRAAILELEAGRCDESRHYLDEAAAELADVESAAAHLSLALTGLHMVYRSGGYLEVEASIADVERLGGPVVSPRPRVMVLVGRCHLALVAGRYVQGREHLSELLSLAAELGDVPGEQVRRPGFVL